MQHLGLAPTMSLIITWDFEEIFFCSCDFWCMDFWVVTCTDGTVALSFNRSVRQSEVKPAPGLGRH